MEFWIVEQGEKRGPTPSYEVRARIERGELSGEELAWHQDRDDWVPLREMDVFRSSFEEPVVEELPVTPPPLPAEPRPFLRFWARWFDVFTYLMFVYGILLLTGQDLYAARLSPWFASLHMVPFLILEGIALHLWKTTPGKFLLGIRVQTVDGGNLSAGQAILRSVRVYILGMGMIFPILQVVCHAFSLWFTLKNGEAPWDTVARTEVRVAGPFPTPVLIFILAFGAILGLWLLIMYPVFVQFAEEEMPGRFPGLG